jgi:hypothetical protein
MARGAKSFQDKREGRRGDYRFGNSDFDRVRRSRLCRGLRQAGWFGISAPEPEELLGAGDGVGGAGEDKSYRSDIGTWSGRGILRPGVWSGVCSVSRSFGCSGRWFTAIGFRSAVSPHLKERKDADDKGEYPKQQADESSGAWRPIFDDGRQRSCGAPSAEDRGGGGACHREGTAAPALDAACKGPVCGGGKRDHDQKPRQNGRFSESEHKWVSVTQPRPWVVTGGFFRQGKYSRW